MELLVIHLATRLPKPSGPQELMQRFFETLRNVDTLAIFFGQEKEIPADMIAQ